MSSKFKIAVTIGWLAVLCGMGISVMRADVKVGDPFPPLTDYGLIGEVPVQLAGKVVVVDFWASWCAPCKASFPALDALQRDLGEKGVMVVGVSVDQKRSEYQAFLKKMSPSFLTLLDTDHRLVKAVSVPTMPTTYILDQRGVVRYVHIGFHGASSVKALREQVTSLLGEKL